MKYIKEDEKKDLILKHSVSSQQDLSQLDIFLENTALLFELSHKTPFYKYLSVMFQTALNKDEAEWERIKNKFSLELQRKPQDSFSQVAPKILNAFDKIQNTLADENSSLLLLLREHVEQLVHRLEQEKNSLLGRLLQEKARKDMLAVKAGKCLDVKDWESYKFLQETKKVTNSLK